MMTIGQDQKKAGPPRPMPTPKLPYDPVDTLMKLNAIAKFDRKPRVRRSSGLMPSERRWASSRSATSWLLTDPATMSSSYHRTDRCETVLWGASAWNAGWVVAGLPSTRS